MLCVPGGAGINALLSDEETLGFVHRQAEGARFVTSVCTGRWCFGAAGLLKESGDDPLGVAPSARDARRIPVHERVVSHGKLMTGGGVTAGIDFALTLVAELAGREIAEAIQLNLEYAPAPPFDGGHPSTATAAVVEIVRSRLAPMVKERERIVAEAAAEAQQRPAPLG